MEDSDIQVILTTKQVLFNFKLSRETLRRWTEKGLQRVERGKFDLREVIRFRDENIFGSNHDEKQKAETRIKQAKATIAELEVAELEKSLIPKEQVLKWLSEIILEARQALLNIPHRLCEQLVVETDSKVILEILRNEIYDALNRLGTGRKSIKKNLEKGGSNGKKG